MGRDNQIENQIEVLNHELKLVDIMADEIVTSDTIKTTEELSINDTSQKED